MTYLYVDLPVASLQADLDTEGSFSLEVPGKQVATSRLPDGKLRILIYSLGQATFHGRIGTVDRPVIGISRVVGSDPNGIGVACRILKLSKVQGLRIT